MRSSLRKRRVFSRNDEHGARLKLRNWEFAFTQVNANSKSLFEQSLTYRCAWS
jgi:hypothetical protein